MEVIKVTDYPQICDRIEFDIQEGKIRYVNFSLNGENVMIEIKNLLTDIEISHLPDIQTDEQYLPVITELKNCIEKSSRKSMIKNKISILKHK